MLVPAAGCWLQGEAGQHVDEKPFLTTGEQAELPLGALFGHTALSGHTASLKSHWWKWEPMRLAWLGCSPSLPADLHRG